MQRPCKAAAQACSFFTPKLELEPDLGWLFHLEAKWGPQRGENRWKLWKPGDLLLPDLCCLGPRLTLGMSWWHFGALHPLPPSILSRWELKSTLVVQELPPSPTITGATYSSRLSNRFKNVLGEPISVATSWGQCCPRVQDAIHPTVCTAVLATGARAGEASSPEGARAQLQITKLVKGLREAPLNFCLCKALSERWSAGPCCLMLPNGCATVRHPNLHGQATCPIHEGSVSLILGSACSPSAGLGE